MRRRRGSAVCQRVWGQPPAALAPSRQPGSGCRTACEVQLVQPNEPLSGQTHTLRIAVTASLECPQL